MTTRQRAALAQRYETDGMGAACPQKLLLAVFERIRSDVDDAGAAIAEADVERAHRRLLNAQELVYELDLALDTDLWEAGLQLRGLYRHLLGLLTEANLTKSPDPINQCLSIIVPLQETWIEAHRQLNPTDSVAAP